MRIQHPKLALLYHCRSKRPPRVEHLSRPSPPFCRRPSSIHAPIKLVPLPPRVPAATRPHAYALLPPAPFCAVPPPQKPTGAAGSPPPSFPPRRLNPPPPRASPRRGELIPPLPVTRRPPKYRRLAWNRDSGTPPPVPLFG